MFTSNFLMPNLFWLNLIRQKGDRGPHEYVLCSAQYNYIQHC